MEDWIYTFGNICPGFERGAHPSDDLTCDHTYPQARGGSSDYHNLGVLCRSCNARKSDRITTRATPPATPRTRHPLLD